MATEPVTTPPVSPPIVAPQPHIRTFAQDVARLSGKPFPPVPKKMPPAPVPEVKKPAPAPLPPPPEPPPAQIIPKAPTTDESREAVLARLRANMRPPEPETPSAPIIPKAPSTGESRDDVLARLRAKAATSQKESEIKLPEVAPASFAPPTPPPQKERERITTPLTEIPEGPARIHTYKTDFAGRAQTQDASRISVLAAEADALPTDRVVFKEKKPFPTAIVGGFLLILLGGGALYAAYRVATNQPVPIFVVRVPSLVAPDERKELTGTNISSDFLSAVREPLPTGAVRVIYTSLSTTTDEGVATTLPQSGGTLLKALALPMPDILERSIMNESTVGAVNEGGEQRAFFILRVDSYERSFAGMLEWERRIQQDLAEFYPAYPKPVVEVSSTTPSATPIAVSIDSSFKDELLGNRDVRVLRDEENRPLIVYGFRDKETLLIVRNEASYLALVARLAASRGE